MLEFLAALILAASLAAPGEPEPPDTFSDVDPPIGGGAPAPAPASNDPIIVGGGE